MGKNTTINLSEGYKQAQDRVKGLTAETSKSKEAEAPKATLSEPSVVTKTVTQPKKTGYTEVDTVSGGNAVLGIKKEYEIGQKAFDQNFHQSDAAKGLRAEADTIRKTANLSDEKFGSGVTSQDVLQYYEVVQELGNIKTEFEKKNALDPSFAQSEEGRRLSARANDIRSRYGLSDAEYGSSVTGAEVLKKAGAINNLYGVKNRYENAYHNSPEAQALRKAADDIRMEFDLPEEKYGSKVTSDDVVNYLQDTKNSPSYQRDLAYQKYGDTNRQLNDELVRELSTEEKMRAILDRVQAEKIAEEQVGAQLDKEIRDSLAYEDELAAQRGSYGQLSYGKRRALKEESLLDNRNARIQAMVQALIEEDRQKAAQEYQEALTRKENRMKAITQKMNQNAADFQLGQQYRNELSQEEAARQQAIYEGVKAQYDQAFEMSNALGYITPELSQLTGIEAGTPMFKMLEYYGDLEKFYAELDLEARRVAVEEYYATRPRYSYSGNNNPGKSTLTWNQANAIWQRFSSDYAQSNGSQPKASDLMLYLNQQQFSPEDQEAIILAAGFTPKNVLDYETSLLSPRDAEGRTKW